MPDEKTCREYVAAQRWEGGKAVCPHCGYGKCYNIEGGKRYKCGSSACYKKFSVITGTIMEASNLPLIKWLTAIYLVSSHKKGISSYQLGRDLEIAQKNAWFVLHRIREMLRVKENVKLDSIVEVDETYIGGKVPNMSKKKRTYLRETGNTSNTKTMVMGMIERGGNLKLVHVGGSTTPSNILPVVRNSVDNDAVLITDSLAAYTELAPEYAAHEVVNHSEQEYVRDKVFHTNTIEGAFSLLKRSIIGIYHQVTPKHLSRYCDETMYRYNLRKMTDVQRFNYTMTNIGGRLKYTTLISAPDNKPILSNKVEIKAEYVKSKRRAIKQVLNGEVIAEYPSVREAAKQLKLNASMIRRVLMGQRVSTGGFLWIYA
jgi:transposase-like protein